jgi:alkaline phosphatase
MSVMSRRTLLAAAQAAALRAAPGRVRLAVLTDVHYADRDPACSRHYRDSIAKMRQAAEMLAAASPDLAVELGDFIDEAPTAAMEASWAKTIDAEFRRLAPERHYVLGNHCIWTLTKSRFMAAVGAKRAHYSFDRAGWHFIVLDGCWRADGVEYGARNNRWQDSEIPPAQRRWLQSDLASARGPVVVFVHQRLDPHGDHTVASAAAVRAILEKSGNVELVLQGHSHANDRQDITGIPYVTLAAMIEGPGLENNAFGLLELSAGGMSLTGYGRQQSLKLPRRSSP